MIQIIKAYDRVGNILVNNEVIGVRKVNTQYNAPLGKIQGIVLHWSAGPKNIIFDDYHINSALTQKDIVMAQTLKPTQKGQHLWGRNSSMLGVSMSCMDNPGDTPSDNQVSATALFVAEACCWYQLDPAGNIELNKKKISGDKLIDVYNSKGQLEKITVPVISDHSIFARLDGYYPDRVDIGKYLPIIVKQAKAYYKELKEGKRQFIFKEIL